MERYGTYIVFVFHRYGERPLSWLSEESLQYVPHATRLLVFSRTVRRYDRPELAEAFCQAVNSR